LFAALVMPRMFKRADAARATAAKAQINGFMTALGAYKLDTSTYPTTEQGLAALRVAPPNTPVWKGSIPPAGRAERSVEPALRILRFRVSTGTSLILSRSEQTAPPAAKASTPTS
jgi:type II secretory pathway pseudopilin PulG